MRQYYHTCPKCGEEGTIYTTGGSPSPEDPCVKCAREWAQEVLVVLLDQHREMDLNDAVEAVREKTGMKFLGPLRMQNLDSTTLLHLARRMGGVGYRITLYRDT